jgi:hypothetical protein
MLFLIQFFFLKRDGRDMSKGGQIIGDVVCKMEMRVAEGSQYKDKFWVTYIKGKEHSIESAWVNIFIFNLKFFYFFIFH